MATQLTPATQALLDAAFNSRDAAAQADNDAVAATTAKLSAHDAETKALQAENDAHKKSSDDAHAALAAVANELGFPLPA